MSRARLAALHRQLAEVHEEISRELTAGEPLNEPPKVRQRRIHKPYVPQRQFSEVETARARQRAKKLGIPT